MIVSLMDKSGRESSLCLFLKIMSVANHASLIRRQHFQHRRRIFYSNVFNWRISSEYKSDVSPQLNEHFHRQSSHLDQRTKIQFIQRCGQSFSFSFFDFDKVQVRERQTSTSQSLFSLILAISFNLPNFCPNAFWNPNAITLIPNNTIGSQPYTLFVAHPQNAQKSSSGAMEV